MNKSRLIICITGMPGSGKSTVSCAASNFGISIVNMGDVVREEALKRQLSLKAEDIGEIMINIRKEMGEDAVARLCLPRIFSFESDIILVDGIRSPAEIYTFKKIGKVKILAIDASKGIRRGRLLNRGRADAPYREETFDERDQKEKSVGVEKVMAIADKILSNDKLTAKEFIDNVTKILKSWIDEHED